MLIAVRSVYFYLCIMGTHNYGDDNSNVNILYISYIFHNFSDEDVDTSIMCSLILSEVETLALGEPPVPAVVPAQILLPV